MMGRALLLGSASDCGCASGPGLVSRVEKVTGSVTGAPSGDVASSLAGELKAASKKCIWWAVAGVVLGAIVFRR